MFDLDRGLANNLARFQQLVRRVEPSAKLLHAWPLKGGVSAEVTALEVSLYNGQTKKMVVRRHGDNDLVRNPRIAANEFRLLHILHAAGLPTPRPYYVDPSGEFFASPIIVIEYIEGSSDQAPHDVTDRVSQLAGHLARIHRVDSSGLAFLPTVDDRFTHWLEGRPAEINQPLNEEQVRAVLASAWPFISSNEPGLMHGDFWPGNILWWGGQLVGIIDWEDAAIGDPLADLANSRLEILWAYGMEAMQCFTDHYRSQAAIDFVNLPYWDLYAGLRSIVKVAAWGLDPARERKVHQDYRIFIAQALDKLARL